MESEIFLTDPDRYQGEDLVWGTVGETERHFSEVHAEYKTVTTDKDGASAG